MALQTVNIRHEHTAQGRAISFCSETAQCSPGPESGRDEGSDICSISILGQFPSGLKDCFVFFDEIFSQTWPQEDTEERLGKTKFIIVPGPGDGRPSTPYGVRVGEIRVVRKQKMGRGA